MEQILLLVYAEVNDTLIGFNYVWIICIESFQRRFIIKNEFWLWIID